VRKIEWGRAHLGRGGGPDPSVNTMRPGPRLTYVPNFIPNPSNRRASVLNTQPDRIRQTGRQTDNRLIA